MRLSGELTRSLIQPAASLRSLERLWFPAAVGVYLLLIAGLRSLVAKSLMFDESEQLALSQVLSLGYGAQPPLVVWIVWVAGTVFGPSTATILGVRYAILGFMYIGLYACGRALTATHERAALAAASALLVPAVCWDFVLDKTNTPMACAMAAFTVAALIRAVRNGELRWAVVVGTLIGLGTLSKYTFIPFAAGLVLASLTVPVYRQWMLSRRGVIALAVTVAIVLPHAAWVLASRAELSESMTLSLTTDRPDRTFGMMLSTAGDVLASSCAVTLVVFAVFAPHVFRRNANTSSETRLLGRALLLGALTAVVVVLLAGGNRFKAHWFTPLAVLLPTFLIARIDFTRIARQRVIGLWATIGVVVLGMVAGAGMIGTTDWLRQGRSLRARDQLAVDVARALDVHPESIVCDSPQVAGNLRLACPGASVAVLRTPMSSRPAVHGSAILVWDASKNDTILDKTAMLLLRDYGLSPDPTSIARFAGELQTSTNPGGRRLGIMRLVPIESTSAALR
ncbi:MAG: glycosyltransferase family 39 protein [Planctomycetes bacterium]|nr:glycosyltransferase family 39 protein [Planctomycetota bacterium]